MLGITRNESRAKISRPLTRVELHIHLAGAIRHEAIYELSLKKGLQLPGDGSFQALQNYLIVKNGYETSKKWIWDLAASVIKGLKRGEADFRCKGNIIVTFMRGDENIQDTLELAADKDFHQGRIVGIDIAGDSSENGENEMVNPKSINIFEEAVKAGISRTVHAGESGSASDVMKALDVLHANRIGHGYRAITDSNLYERIKTENIHLELCPWSSILTGAVSPFAQPHPIVTFFQDNLNVSINTDDPTVTNTWLDDEFRLLTLWGLNEYNFVKASFNAAKSSFLPPNEKNQLTQELAKMYGMVL